MAGEAYAMTYDLVQHIATSPEIKAQTKGKEDQLVSRWMKMHPQAEEITWVTDRCWVYDHPKAGTV
jgi:predicted 3-demethylubiquinone-9 3-methyltransferase (glyoxalase superfamily)